MPEVDAAERDAILAERDRIATTRVPSNLTGCGVLLFLFAVCMLAALPGLLADPAFGAGAKTVMTVVVLALTMIGLWLTIRGNRKKRFARRQIDLAVTELQRFPEMAPTDRRVAAVRLVWFLRRLKRSRRLESLHTDIPDALPYVRAVQEVLKGSHSRAS